MPRVAVLVENKGKENNKVCQLGMRKYHGRGKCKACMSLSVPCVKDDEGDTATLTGCVCKVGERSVGVFARFIMLVL